MCIRPSRPAVALAVALGIALATPLASPRAQHVQDARDAPAPARRPGPQLDCGFEAVARATAAHVAAVRRGEIVPRVPPVVAPRRDPRGKPAADGGQREVSPDDLFLHEDSALLLTTDWDYGDLLALMTDAANALMVEHGDAFDFVGYWLCFEPESTLGAAFYQPIENDVLGIGDVGAAVGEPSPLFDLRPAFGIAGDRIEGFVMMWNIDSGFWAPGTGPEADFARLALGQEFEHRFGLFLPALAGGQALQGNDAGCGRSFHWNWKVDGQGSSMEISEWTGTAPATPTGLFVTYNTDLPGSVWSWSDLYLMGYATPAEMDAGNSELRYMLTSNCGSNYNGAILDFDSSDIVAVAGPRVPDAAAEDKHYRTGWVVFHLPGSPPTPSQLDDIAGILTQHQVDWSASSLGRGSMTNTLPGPSAFTDLGQGLAGAGGVPLLVGDGTLVGGTTATLTLTGAAASTTSALFIGLSSLGAPFKGGVMVPHPDVLILGLPTGLAGSVVLSATWPMGLPSGFDTWYQHWITDATGPAGFAASNALLGTTP
jgi:hypothetical protein